MKFHFSKLVLNWSQSRKNYLNLDALGIDCRHTADAQSI